MRWQGIPPDWAVDGMKHFDVYSLNNYRPKMPRETTDKINSLLNMPTMIGEWHFGALDVGLPGSGLVHVRNQVDRGRAYRVYVEDAAANPNCSARTTLRCTMNRRWAGSTGRTGTSASSTCATGRTRS